MYIFLGFIFGLLILIFKKISDETKKYIFCALDFSDLELTLNFAKKIKDHVSGIKLG